jgi:hypothetical protein
VFNNFLIGGTCMKKVVGLVLVLALLSPAFATTVGVATDQPDTATGGLAPGGTAYHSTAVWKVAQGGAIPVNTPAWAGAMQDSGGLWFKTEYNMSQHGATLILDTDIGDGTSYTIGTDATVVKNTAAKLQVKNGTFVVNGKTIWNDKFQNGTVARTSFGTNSSTGLVYAGKSAITIGQGGAIRVTGTDAVGAGGGNFVFSYGANVDSFVKTSGTGILSGITRDGLGVYLGGRTMEFGRSGSYAGNMIDFEISGSSATVEVASMKMNGNAATNSILRYITDTGGVSAINLYGAGANVLTYGALSKLDFQLGAAATEGQVYTLINLIDGTATQNATAGRLKTMWGTALNEGGIMNVWYGGIMYGLQASYVGGTGNDVTLTVIPEPATLGLLSLGGMLLARRRRA